MPAIDDGPVQALFVPIDGGCVRATEYARGPWSLDQLHGGPVAALLAHAIETLPGNDVEWLVSRLTIELERPVPTSPLRYMAEITRPGHKVSIVDATLFQADSGTVLARARGVRIRTARVPLPFDDAALAPLLNIEPAPSTPNDGHTIERPPTTPIAFHTAAIEQRFIGDTRQPGPIFVWTRACVPLMPEQALTPLQRVASATDQASGISAVLPVTTHNFINPDLTVHLFRPPQGEWVGMSSATHHHTGGTAMTNTAIYDVAGRIGNSNQSLLLSTR